MEIARSELLHPLHLLRVSLSLQEIPRVKPDVKFGADAEAGFYKEIAVMTAKASTVFRYSRTGKMTTPLCSDSLPSILNFTGEQSVTGACFARSQQYVFKDEMCPMFIRLAWKLVSFPRRHKFISVPPSLSRPFFLRSTLTFLLLRKSRVSSMYL